MKKRVSRYHKIVYSLDCCIDKEDGDESQCEKCYFKGRRCKAKLMYAAKDYIDGFGKVATPEMGQVIDGDVYYCGECGTQVKRVDRYCRGCGTEIDWYEGKWKHYNAFDYDDENTPKPWDYNLR